MLHDCMYIYTCRKYWVAKFTVSFSLTAPALLLEDVRTSITSSQEPFSLVVTWSVVGINSLQHSDHIGFIVSCFENSTGQVNELLRYVLLDSQLTLSYSARVLLPVSCAQSSTALQCSVSPFNERGEGQIVSSDTFGLPCSGGGVWVLFGYINPFCSVYYL